MNPVAGSQASIVHALLSLVFATTCVIAPVVVLHASAVQALPSSILIAL